MISYSFARRTNEIGIRIALGAQAAEVSMLVLRQGVRPVLGGLLVGVAAALAAGELIIKLLFGTEAKRPGGNLGSRSDPTFGRSRGVLGACPACVPARAITSETWPSARTITCT